MTTRASVPVVAERRGCPRFVFPRPGYSHLTATVGLASRYAALVQDVSSGGISLLVRTAFERESLVPIWVPGLFEPIARMLLVQVVHLNTATPGLYRLGGRFVDQASTDQVRPLLGP